MNKNIRSRVYFLLIFQVTETSENVEKKTCNENPLDFNCKHFFS